MLRPFAILLPSGFRSTSLTSQKDFQMTNPRGYCDSLTPLGQGGVGRGFSSRGIRLGEEENFAAPENCRAGMCRLSPFTATCCSVILHLPSFS